MVHALHTCFWLFLFLIYFLEKEWLKSYCQPCRDLLPLGSAASAGGTLQVINFINYFIVSLIDFLFNLSIYYLSIIFYIYIYKHMKI